jgi:thioredoxin-like negative regulator of GroEL
MKGLLTLIALCFAFSAWSDVTYPVKNFKYISDWDYREEVQDSDKYVVMVFSSKSCLERTIIDRSCFMFEKKLDYFVPKFSSNVKVVAFNTYFENYNVASQFQIQKIPTVIIIKSGQIIKRFEATYAQPDINNGRLGWQDELLKEVLSVVSQIH